ncbi:hypothetical protein HML84_14530 [Alcanivorax sp. IO_7]|nr:hypothetical protein HML84_14530 [Alcanivorax sp. IO_7]
MDDGWLELMRLGQRQGLVALPYEDPMTFIRASSRPA